MFKTALERQINEGNRIKNKEGNLLINSKQEFHKPGVDKTKEKFNPEFKCENCNFKCKTTNEMNNHIREHTT